MSYLLLLKYVTPSGTSHEWMVFNDLSAAEVCLEREQLLTKKAGIWAGINCPALVQHLIVKVEVVE